MTDCAIRQSGHPLQHGPYSYDDLNRRPIRDDRQLKSLLQVSGCPCETLPNEIPCYACDSIFESATPQLVPLVGLRWREGAHKVRPIGLVVVQQVLQFHRGESVCKGSTAPAVSHVRLAMRQGRHMKSTQSRARKRSRNTVRIAPWSEDDSPDASPFEVANSFRGTS